MKSQIGRLALLSLLLTGCKPGAGGQGFQMPPAEVPVAMPVPREITDVEEYSGKLMAVERVNIMARVDGYLSEIRFVPGQLVKKGDVLFVIDRRPYQIALDNANGQFAQAEAKVGRLTKDFSRIERLNKSGAGTIEDFDKVAGDLAEAKALMASATAMVDQAKLNLEFSEVRAPIDGRMGRQLVTVGNLVQGSGPGQATVLTDMVSVDKMYVYFDAPEGDVLRYRRNLASRRKGSEAAGGLAVQVALFDETDFKHKAIVDFMAEKLEAGTGTQTFRAVLPNPGQSLLAEGMFARVRVAFSDPYQGLTVADRAVAISQGEKCLYIINDKDIVEERPVQLGRLVAPGVRHVKGGLKPTDRVAVANLQRLMPGAPVKPVPTAMPMPPQ